MKGDKNDYNSLDFENDVTLDNKNNITINPNVKMEQIANNLNKNQQNRESLDSGSTSAASSNGDQKGGIFKSMKKFFKLDEEQDNNIQNEISNNINNSLESGIPQPNKTEGGESFISQKVSKCKESILKKVEENLEVERSFKTFGIMVAIGLTLLCLSLMFLPVVIISPSKFVMCFSLGSLIILSSFIFVYGTKAYVEKLFAKNRFTFSILFLLSIILGLYFSFAGNYFISILLAVFQLITLIVFTLTFLPGGSTGISFIGTMLMTPVKGVWNRITGRAES